VRYRLPFVALIILALGGSGCVAPENIGPQVGSPAPAYQATTLEGDTVTLASLQGKPVLLNLWATWCAPCRYETPFLQALFEERHPEGLEVVGVSMDTGGAVDLIEEFMEEYGVTYTILADPRMVGMEAYQVLGLPATFLIDREGVLRWMKFGPVSETDQDFLSALETILQ
jgi:cytochrome c-type biogenesis protein